MKKELNFIVTPEFREQIHYLNNKVKDIEWSGILIYKKELNKTEKSITLNIIPHTIIMCDIGSSFYTDIDYKENDIWIDYFDDLPDGISQGKIHSHHNMSVTPSATDREDLEEAVDYCKRYLTVIVNNKLEVDAKIGYKTTSVQEDLIYGGKVESSSINVVNCKIIRTFNVNKEIEIVKDSYKRGKKEADKKAKKLEEVEFKNKGTYWNPYHLDYNSKEKRFYGAGAIPETYNDYIDLPKIDDNE